MALTAPILYTIAAFDATQEFTFTFNVIGGDQVTGNTLTIRNNTTLAEVYSQSQTTFRFAHTLPANTLTNGTYYQATLTTTNVSGEISPVSNTIQFYCYTQPTFEFTNIPAGAIITNASYEFIVQYNQIQGEILNGYTFNLYSSFGVLLSTSGPQYNTSSDLPLTISHLFTGFDDNTEYIVECVGSTAEGTSITTGQIVFTASYTAPSLYSAFVLINNCEEGYITIRSNVNPILGDAVPSPPTYIDDSEIDLTQPGSSVTWNDGYMIDGDFTSKIWGRDFTPNSDIIEFSNASGDTVTLRYCEDNTNAWFELRAVHAGNMWGYVMQSNTIPIPESTEYIFIWHRRVGILYDLQIENLGETV